MSEAKNLHSDEITVSEKDLSEAKKLIDSLFSRPSVDHTDKHKAILNRYCEEFNISSYYDLMSKADLSEFSPEVCLAILESYSYVTRRERNRIV